MKFKFAIILPSLVLAMSVGAGFSISSRNKSAEPVEAAIDYSACETAYAANNKANMKTALSNLVAGSVGDYGDLWTNYWIVYKRADGYLKDYYSSVSNFTKDDQDKGSGGTTEGDKFNREHTIPKNWWGGSTSNQGADIFIVVPADKKVNNVRSDNCLGVVGSATFTSENGYSKLGSSVSNWDFFGSPVFEPNDEVKGDLARIYFYSVIKYDVKSWTNGNGSYVYSGNTSASSNYGLTTNAIKLLSYWNNLDKPDDWERSVNVKGNSVQGNPNPFIDHPEYANTLWSDVSGYTTYTNSGITVSVSPSSGSISVGETLSLTATTSGGSGSLTWSSSNTNIATVNSSGVVTGVAAGSATITATYSGETATCSVTVTKAVSSLSKGATSPTKTTYTAGESFDPTGLTITATYSDSTTSDVTSSVVWTPDPLTAGTTSVTGTYGGKTITITGITVNQATEPEIIDSNSDLSVGDYVVLRTAAGVGVTGWNDSKDATVSETQSEWKKFYVASASNSGFTLKDESANNFIASPGSTNQFIYGSAGTCSTDSDGHLKCNNRYLCKNGTNYRFYTSIGSYLPFFIYKVPASSTKTLSSISVATAPTKTTYTAGECFDPTGLVITRTYSDSTSDTYTYANHTTEFTFSPTTSTALTTSDVSVTITYGGKSCSQAITVNAAKTLSSISVSTAPTKTTYTSGEYFDPTGLVIRRNYSDSTYDTYSYSGHTSEFTFSPSTSTALTTSNVSVTITYGGKSTSQTITVNPVQKTLSSISVSGGKTSFTVDESFSFGGTVTAHYSDSSSSDVTSSATFSGYNMSIAGNYTVTVSYTYGDKTETETYQITVNASGGGGNQPETGSQRVVSNSGSSNYQAGSIYFTLNNKIATSQCDAFTVTWNQNDGSNGIDLSFNEIRVYGNHSFSITPNYGYTLTSIVITATSNNYANAVGGSSLTNCTKNVSNSTATLSPSDGTSTVAFRNTAQSRINYVVVNYEYGGSSSVDPITSISATVSKTYYVGDTISKSDITVKDSNNQTISPENYTFFDDGYQFKYSDAQSGGNSTQKTFLNTISYESFTCNLSVNILRKPYVSPSGSASTQHTGSEFGTGGVGGSYAENQTATVDGITFSVDGYIYQSRLSLSPSRYSATGKVINITPYPGAITNVSVDGASPDIQLSTDGNSWVNYGTAATNTTNYYYLKIYYSNTTQSNFVNINSISVSYDVRETPKNLSNYIMYEDTSNQCVSKLSTAIGYYQNLVETDKTTFQTSNDYVISTARERLEAWAAAQGKTINYTNGTLSNRANVFNIYSGNDNETTLFVLILSVVSLSTVALCFIIKRKRLEN